ncbi:reverse transcriptase domain-containing protein [Tanacetum coccineum]
MLYLVVSHETINSVLMAKRKNVQRPIYFVNGASGSDGSGAGVILTDPAGKEITYALRFDLPTSNNEAEYEALIAGTYEAYEESMKWYLSKVQSLQKGFESFSITQIYLLKNKRADALNKLASSSFAHLTKNVLVEVIPYKSIEAYAINTMEDVGETWMTPIIEYLQDRKLPEDPKTERKIRIKAPQYSMKVFYTRKVTQHHGYDVLFLTKHTMSSKKRTSDLAGPIQGQNNRIKGRKAWILLAHNVP